MKSSLLPGFSSRRLVILMFYLDKSVAHYFIYSLPVSIKALFACYMSLLTIQVIVFNILNQARSRFRKDVAVLRRTQNFLSSDIPLTNINLSSDIPASYLRHPVTNKYDNNPKEILKICHFRNLFTSAISCIIYRNVLDYTDIHTQ